MLCRGCGREIADNSRFCEFCGTQVNQEGLNQQGYVQLQNGYQGQGYVQPQNGYQELKAEKPKKAGNKKSKTPIILIGSGVLLLLVVAGVLAFRAFRGRKLQKTFDMYVTAANEEDEDALYKVLFPKNEIETVQDSMVQNDMNVFETFCPDKSIKEITVNETMDIDKDLQRDFDELLDNNFGVELDYEDIKTASVQVEYSGESVTKSVIVYKIGRTWYVMPEMIELIVAEKQNSDIAGAQRISNALSNAMCYETAYTDMIPYFGAVISLDDDMDYLPQTFVGLFNEELGELPELEYTVSGATGYAFRIDDGVVTVYISTEQKMDEWQIYPTTDESYYAGEISESDDTDLSGNSDYSYVKLVSQDSPIIGYWQSDSAGMYIGYNASGGDEGFTIYIQVHTDTYESGFRILHSYNGYDYSCDEGNIKFQGLVNGELEENYEFHIDDESHITMTAQMLTDSELVSSPTQYSFEKSEITEDVTSLFIDTWISADEYGYGSELNLVYDSACGCIHDDDNQWNLEYYHEGTFITLYDGQDCLQYIFPDEGLYMEYEGIGYSGDEYTLKGDSLALSTYRHGGGGGMDYLYVRQGTKKAEVAKVIGAYNDYLSDNGVSYSGLEYIYLDDDDIPELVYRDSRLLLDTLLTYSDGQVYATVLPDWGMGELSYRERTGEFMLSGVNGSFGHMDFYKYENGAVAHLGVAEHQTLEDGTEGFYIAEGEEYSGAETDKQTYTNFVNEFGSYDSTPSFENTYFNTASYELLQKY